MNFTVTSRGRQFDRLGLMYLGDIEVFRTSTAEPTTNGIIWTYIKEMEQYNALWRTNQKIIFDLGNLIDSTYTGTFNTTLTATFFTVPDSKPTADQILPISAQMSGNNMGSAWAIPPAIASIAQTLPRNVERAVVSLSACGQATEEFWYTNVLQSEVSTFENSIGTLYGYSPFREVQLLIDGQLAGVSWPFPVIFTGGIAPGFWRPIVGIDAFDLREHEIDITPWLPLLCDGASHTFEIRVAGINDDGKNDATLSETVGSNWVVTGKIFLFLDKAGSISTGPQPTISTPAPNLQISSSLTTNSTGTNETLTYQTTASRSLSITSTITTSTGSKAVSWTQTLTYTNLNILSSQGLVQYTKQSTTGTDRSSSGYASTYSYPITVNSSISIDAATGNFGINASLTRGLDLNIYGPSVFPSGIQTFNLTSTPAVFSLGGQVSQQPITLPASLPVFSAALLSTTQTASARYLSAGNASFSFGTTEQEFRFGGVEVGNPESNFELYRRSVEAVNSTVVSDEESLAGRSFAVPQLRVQGAGVESEGGFSVRELLGRGPGKADAGLFGGEVRRVVVP